MSEVAVSDCTPNIFMSLAERLAAGGDGRRAALECGDGGASSQEKGEAGGDDGLSLRVIIVVVDEALRPSAFGA